MYSWFDNTKGEKNSVITKILNHFKWFYVAYKDTRGMSLTSVLFYGTSVLIMFSIPITVVLLKTEKDSITRASSSPLNYNDPPITTIDVPPNAKRGELVTLAIVSTNSNWTVVYHSPAFPATSTPSPNSPMTVVSQGPHISTANFIANSTGYFMPVSYQLQQGYGEFKSGDIMCSWDGGLYIYKKKTANPIIEMIDSNAKYEGTWDRLTTCQNGGVKQLVVGP